LVAAASKGQGAGDDAQVVVRVAEQALSLEHVRDAGDVPSKAATA
jgi:hypothetical protein